MGCHTWFYKKSKTPTTEEMKSVVKDHCERELEFLEKLIHRREEIDQDLLEAYPEWTPEYAIENKARWENLLAFSNGEPIDLTIFGKFFFEENYTEDSLLENLYSSWSGNLMTYVKGKGFYETTDFHDVFRKYRYPDDQLFSLEETLAYINNPENGCSTYENTTEMLKRFWEEHPDGMINFG